MTNSLYVLPFVTITGPKGTSRQPAHQDIIGVLDRDIWDYGDNPWCLLSLVNVPTATDTQLRAQSDVFALPQNLDTTVGSVGTRNTIRTGLESAEIPGSWVQTTTTYREIVRFVGACCWYARTYQGLVGGVLFPGVVNLDSTFGSLPQAQQQGMLSTAANLALDTTTWTATATLRTVMTSAANQVLSIHGLPTFGGLVL